MSGTNAPNSDLVTQLETLLTALAKQVLKRRPEDVEYFCLEFLADKLEMQLSPVVKVHRGLSMAADEDLYDLAADVDSGKVVSGIGDKEVMPKERVYKSSDESEHEVHSIASYHSNFDFADDFTGSDAEDAARVKTAAPLLSTIHDDLANNGPVCRLFSQDGISNDELEKKTRQYQGDERMKSLFRAWDGDGSGAVDFVELVLALHKFEQVAAAGIDIQVASDALVQFVESDTERELKLPEFTRVIILFARNNFKKDFEEVADHMLEVATSTSEAAVLSARSGVDTTEIEAADKEEEEFLRETVKGMEEHVTDNIRKIRTKRVAFRQSMTHLSLTD